MSFSVLNNISGMNAQRNLYSTELGLNKTISRLSSGLRIVDAGDDASGLAIANSLNADYHALTQAVRNATDGKSILNVADGALSKISDLLTRAVTLAEQSASETVGSEERVTINEEYQSLLSEIDRVVSVTNFKGSRLFDESGTVSKSIFVGDTNFASTINISIGGASGSNSTSLGLTTDLTTASNAQDVLGELNSAIGSVSSWRGSLGAQSNRLTNAVSVIKVQAQNILAAKSNILDADIAQEISNMNKFQILMQSGMSSLAQANASSQLVMSLFK